MTAKWLICNLGKDDHIQRLFYAVKECGREAEVVSFKDFAEALEVASDERACIVTSGSIWLNTQIRKMRPNWTGNWHNEEMYKCTRYYAYWGQFLSQQKYIMLPFQEVLRQKDWLFEAFGSEGRLFLRPNSGEKQFVGEVVTKEQMASWEEIARTRWVDYEPSAVGPDMLCIAAPPRKLQREFRLLIHDGKVVTGSLYRDHHHNYQEPLEGAQDKDKIVAFAEMVLSTNPPPLPPIYVLDLAEIDGELSVMEVGCYCCAGLYEMDRRKVAQAVSEAAEKEFTENKK
jgi:hypothetical protein